VDGKQATGVLVAPEDFEAAFREHFAPVYRFIARRVGRALAEDLAAEVFATAYRRRDSYLPSRGTVRSWLYGIAANVLREHWRDEQQLLELDARVAHDWLGPLPGPAQFADAADERVIAATLAPRIAGALARSRLSRGRAALRAQLGEFDFDQWTFREQDHA
jgi:RNA polymerase sigma-70 factor (ECF subfamily)